jgi:type II secretory pathway predicted ATPase ExeA
VTYRTLVHGLSFRESISEKESISGMIPRSTLVKSVKGLISPNSESGGYSLVIGEHGSGKTSLIKLAINDMSTPKGVAYIMVPDTPYTDNNSSDVTDSLKKALGWRPDSRIDDERGK